MANAVYPKYKKAAMSGGSNVNLLTGAVKMILVDAGTYTYSAAHEFLSDVPSAARVSISGALAGKSCGDDGSFKSSNGRFDGVIGASVEEIILFVDTGVEATSRLIVFRDTGITGLPVTPAGESYNVIVDPAGWFVM